MQQTNPMRMERRRLADLIPAAYNPRKALTPEDPEYQDIKASIQGLGYADPIVINYDGTIIKGHQRRTVMMDMGIEEAEVVVLDIRDKAKEKMINVALNKITGKWDLQILKDLLSDLDLNGYDFSVTGFHQDDLEDLIQQLDVPERLRPGCSQGRNRNPGRTPGRHLEAGPPPLDVRRQHRPERRCRVDGRERAGPDGHRPAL